MLNSVNWDYFKLKDLFTVESSKNISNKEALNNKGDIPYVTTKGVDNGILCYTNKGPFYEGNKITIAGSGSIFATYFQEQPFTTSQRLYILTLKDMVLDKNIGLFLTTIISKEKDKYSYGRQVKLKDVLNTKIRLPVSNIGNPNWTFMRDYIRNLSNNNLENLSEPQIIKKTFLTDRKWVHFKVLDLFEIKRGLRLTKERREEGEIPFITAGELNSGVSAHIKHNIVNVKYESDISITTDMFGNAFARNYIFGFDDNVYTLKNKNMNIFNSIFISTIIKQNKYRYSYGRQCRLKNINIDIKLPVDKHGNPDWQFMEDYIKSLPYTKYL